MAQLNLVVVASLGKTLSVTIERISDGLFFNPTAQVFQAGISYSNKRVLLSEGLLENAGSYTASISGVSGQTGLNNPGLVRVRVHDELQDNQTISVIEGSVVGGAFVTLDASVLSRATPDDIQAQVSSLVTEDLLLPSLTELPAANPTIASVLALLWTLAREKSTSSNSRFRVYNESGSPLFEATLVPTEGGFERQRLVNVNA